MMSGVKGGVHFDDHEWRGFIGGFRRELSNPNRLLKAAFATAGFRDVIEHFKEAKGPGGPWPARAKTTQAAYAKRNKYDSRYNPSNRLLQLTGNLRGNFLPSNIEEKGLATIVFFNPTPYASAHDNGSSKRNLPKREFMWLSDKAQETMLNIILDKAVGE